MFLPSDVLVLLQCMDNVHGLYYGTRTASFLTTGASLVVSER